MSCVKNCERETPELNRRPIGLDYGLPWLVPSAFQDPKQLEISQVETNFWMGALLTVLQGSVLAHYLPKIFYDIGLDPAIVEAVPSLETPFLTHAAFAATLMALPGLLSLAADSLSLPLETAVSKLGDRWGKVDERKLEERKVIVDIYNKIMQSDKSLKMLIGEFDPDGDGMISTWEIESALDHLEIPKDRQEIFLQAMSQRITPGKGTKVETWLDCLDK